MRQCRQCLMESSGKDPEINDAVCNGLDWLPARSDAIRGDGDSCAPSMGRGHESGSLS